MSDLLEEDLRETFAEHDARYDPAPALARLRARAYPSGVTRTRRLWLPVAALSSMVAAGIVAVVLVLSSGASVAYAGWTPMPTTPTPAALSAAVAKCRQTGQCVGRRVLTDARGPYVALIYLAGGQFSSFVTAGRNSSSGFSGPIPGAPGRAQLGAPSMATPIPPSDISAAAKREAEVARLTALQGELAAHRGSPSHLALRFHLPGLAQQLHGETGTQAIVDIKRRITEIMQHPATPAHPQISENRRSASDAGYALGRAGGDVSAVTFKFTNGKTVDTTVEHGWYFAWWPWTGFPTSARITTATGTLESPMPGKQCRQDPSNCAFVG